MEFAIIFPLFGLMIFAIIIGGIYYDAGNAAQAAANIAVNEARVYGATARQGEQAAEDFIASNAKNLHDTTDLRFVVSVRDVQHLEAALRHLKHTPSVLRVQRIKPHG